MRKISEPLAGRSASFHDVGTKSREELLGLGLETRLSVADIGFIDFDADTVALAIGSGEKRRAGAHKRIKDRVTDEREHADEAISQLRRKGSWMLASGFARNSPDLLEPVVVFVFGKA